MHTQESLEVHSRIKDLLEAHPTSILSLENQSILRSLQDRKKSILAHELLTWQLKSRVQWDTMGDTNTKFCHSIASSHRNHNSIWALQNVELSWIESDEQLKELEVKHFTGIFKDDNQTNIVDQLKAVQLFPAYLSHEQAACFDSETTLSEIEGALKTFKKDKIPGPDGWTIEFFLEAYNTIGLDLLHLVEESQINGHFHPPLNSTLLSLIPKTKNLDCLEDFRPISL